MTPDGPLRYRRVILKLSGESLGDATGSGVELASIGRVAEMLAGVRKLGVELGVVIGGGNIIRGISASEQGVSRGVADYMGMMATMINALAVEDRLERMGVEARVLSPIGFPQLAEAYIPRRAIRHLERGRVVLLAAGTGNPYFTTDTAAALRSVELGAEVLLKATKVDGIYSADPKKDPKAVRYDRLGYLAFLEQGIKVMDATAVTLCMDHKLPIIVFDLNSPDVLPRVLRGEKLGTMVGEA
jgi:uridylate kinase